MPLNRIAIIVPTFGDRGMLIPWAQSLVDLVNKQREEAEDVMFYTIFLALGNALPVEENFKTIHLLQSLFDGYHFTTDVVPIVYPTTYTHVEAIRLATTTALSVNDFTHILILEDDALILNPEWIHKEIIAPAVHYNRLSVSYAQTCPESVQDNFKVTEWEDKGPGIWPQLLCLTRKQAIDWIVENNKISPRVDEAGAWDIFASLGKEISEDKSLNVEVIPSCRYNMRDFSKRPKTVSEFLRKHPNPYQLHIGNMSFVYTTLLSINGKNPYTGQKAAQVNKLTCNPWGNVPCTLGFQMASRRYYKNQDREKAWQELRDKVIALNPQNELLIYRYSDDWNHIFEELERGNYYAW